MSDLTIYECKALIEQIEEIIEQNEGEITEEQMEELVKAQTTSIEKIGRLCGYMKHLEHRIGIAKLEEERIAHIRKVDTNRLANIKRFLVPYVESKKKIEVGTFKLSTRKSTSVEVDAAFDESEYMRIIPESKAPDKKAIKEAIAKGVSFINARIITKTNLQFK